MEIQEVIDNYKSYGTFVDEPVVKKAIEFAIKYHGSQKRASGDPYYYHPLQDFQILKIKHLALLLLNKSKTILKTSCRKTHYTKKRKEHYVHGNQKSKKPRKRKEISGVL